MKRTITLLFIPLLLVLLLAAPIAAVAQPVRLQPAPQAERLALQAAAGDVTLSGTLTVIWADWPDGRADPPRFYLTDAAGARTELAPGLLAAQLLDAVGRRVTVTGLMLTPAAGEPARFAPASLVTDRAATIEPDPNGNSRWLVLGCRFPDTPAPPRPMSFFAGMYRNTFPGLDHYWREVSYGRMDLAGSEAAGWFTLPRNQAAYYDESNGGLDWWDVVNDCTAAADAAIYFPDYDGLSFILNDTRGGPALGGPIFWTLDGEETVYAANWMPTWANETLSVYQHEMGHGYRMGHSASATGATYGNVWDVMANDRASCAADDPLYGCVGAYPIAFHRAEWTVDWLVGRVYEAGPGTHTVDLAPATRPAAAGFQMIRLPIDGATDHFYTVEARALESYDAGLPGDAIILYEIANRLDRAWIIEFCVPEAVCNGDSERAMLRVGETLALAMGNVAVRVDAVVDGVYRLTIVNGATAHHVELTPVADAYVRTSNKTANFGSAVNLLVGQNDSIVSYLDFEPLPKAILAARLRLTATAPLRGEPGDHVAASDGLYKGTLTHWTESGLTFNNAPLANGGWGTPFQTVNGNVVEWDLLWTQYWNTPYQTLQVSNGWQNVPTNQYASREGANPPRLILDYLELPPPDNAGGESHTFLPTNDATVSQAKPKLIAGTKPTLQVKDAAKDFNAYVKFNVAGLTGAVQSATLRLWVRDGGPDGGRVYSTSPFYPNTTTQWLETGLKWNNAPAIGGAILDSAGAVVAGQWIELDVTAAITNNGRASFAVTNDSSNLVVYSSKEGAHAPELIITTNDELRTTN